MFTDITVAHILCSTLTKEEAPLVGGFFSSLENPQDLVLRAIYSPSNNVL